MTVSENPQPALRTAVCRKEKENSPRLSVVIPAFNEANRIGRTVLQISRFLGGLPFRSELIVVDDGSLDETATIVERLELANLRLIRNDTNHGKGYSVKQGVLASTGDYVLFSDADLSAPIEEVDKLLSAAEREEADVVIGSRAVDPRLIERHQSHLREASGVLFNVMVRLVLGLRIRDTQCGFKLFKRENVAPIFEKQVTHGFAFDPELLFLASRQQLKILEIPVRWSHAEGSKIRLFHDAFAMFADLVRIRCRQLMGRYL